ncbi:MAG: GFA family protein [Verrucomicrobium sp.]
MSAEASAFTGGCLCGSVRYEATGRPYNITHCHCADCRRSCGAAFVTWASFRRSDFRFTAGDPKEIVWAGRRRAFCPDCGTPLVFFSAAAASEVDVTVCSLDEPARVQPEDHTWTEDQLSWVKLADSLPMHARQRQKKP